MFFSGIITQKNINKTDTVYNNRKVVKHLGILLVSFIKYDGGLRKLIVTENLLVDNYMFKIKFGNYRR